MQIDMEGYQVELSRKRIKNINLRINSRGEVKVSAPLRTSLEYIQQFLREKSDWIQVRRDRLNTIPAAPAKQLISGEQHFFLGKLYPVHVYENCAYNRVVFESESLHCFVTQNTSVTQRHKLLQAWYRQELKALLPDLIKKWESIIGVSVASWGIKAMKSRWGSCHSVKKHITINLYVMEKPLACLDYVIVHELVHILEASHNARFWGLVARFMPNWKDAHYQLKVLSV